MPSGGNGTSHVSALDVMCCIRNLSPCLSMKAESLETAARKIFKYVSGNTVFFARGDGAAHGDA